MADVYDVAVLGSGPGGYAAAIHAAQGGQKTVLIEKQKRLGGTCTLVGCIPTKALLHSAELFTEFSHAADHGITLPGKPVVDMKGVLGRKNKIIDASVSGIGFLMKKNKITVVHGFGRLAGPGKLSVTGDAGPQEILYKHLVIATGSVVREFAGLESDGRVVLNSDQILELEHVPASMIVAGAGAVGMEFASVFASFGTKVTIVELQPHLLPIEDEDVSKEIEKAYRLRKIGFLLESKISGLERLQNGVKATVTRKDGTTEVLEAELLLSAIGRRPVTEGIGLETTNIKPDARGFLPVDADLRTTEPNVSAIGDVIPTPMLAHMATAEALHAIDALLGRKPEPLRTDRCPGATYSSPEVASVGLTEKAARAKGYDVKTGTFPFSANGKARILGEKIGFVKIVAEKKYDEILGVHMIGPRVTDLIAEASALLRLEATTEDVEKTIHPHPTLSEIMGEAAHATNGHPLHM